MKRILFSITAMTLVLVLAACGTSGDNDKNNENNDATSGSQVEQNDTNNNDSNDNENNDNDANNENNENENNDNNVTEESDESEKTGTAERMDDLSFTIFDLEVEYGEDEYNLDIKYRNDFVNIHLQDDFNEEYKRGRDAFNIVWPALQELDIDQDTDEEDAITQVLEAFELDEDYTGFELEMKFEDDTELEIEE